MAADILAGVFLAGGVYALGPTVSGQRQIIALVCFSMALALATYPL